MWYLTKRKYCEVGGRRECGGLTYYVVEMDEVAVGLKRQVEKVYDYQQPKIDLNKLIKTT